MVAPKQRGRGEGRGCPPPHYHPPPVRRADLGLVGKLGVTGLSAPPPEARAGAMADAQRQPQNRLDRSSALRFDASSNLRQRARETGRAWRGAGCCRQAGCLPALPPAPRNRPTLGRLASSATGRAVSGMGAGLAWARARGDEKGARTIVAGPLGTNGSMTEDTPGLETRGVRFDARHLDFQLFIHQMICPAREAACEPLASCSASPAKLGQNAKLSHSRPDRVSVEKLSLMFLDLYGSNPPQQQPEGPRALLLSAALLTEEREGFNYPQVSVQDKSAGTQLVAGVK